MRNHVFIFFAMLLFMALPVYSQAGSQNLKCQVKTPLTADLKNISLQVCQQQKASPQCQKLYSEIKESGEDVSSRSLRCEVESDLTLRENFAVSAIGCLRGGIYDGIVEPVLSLGRAIGTGAASVVTGWNAAEERRKNCDAHPEQKLKMYEVYNQGVPQLLKISVPSSTELAKMKCSDVEFKMFAEKSLKEERARKVELRRGGRFEKFSAEEQKYLDWKIANLESVGKNQKNLWDLADQALKKYNISIDCYNKEAQWALRCEALFNVATLVGTGGSATAAKMLAKISGLKASRFVAAVGKTVEEAGALKSITEAQKLDLLRKANSLSNADRIKAAEQLTGKVLTSTEADQLIAIHELPLSDLKKKADALKALGYNSEQRNVLMRTGITGELDEYIRGALSARKYEQSAMEALPALENREGRLQASLKDASLPAAQKEKLQSDLASVQSQIAENQTRLREFMTPTEASDIRLAENRIGLLSHQIEIADATEQKTARLVEVRAKSLKDFAEMKAADKSYDAAKDSYDLAAKDVKSALKSGGLKTTKDKLDALGILQNAGVEKYAETYNDLSYDIAQSLKNKGRRDMSTLELGPPTFNPAVLNEQKDSAWALAREVKEQSLKIHLQRTLNEQTTGSSWYNNTRLDQQFEAMVEKQTQMEQALEKKLTKDVGATQAQKLLKKLLSR